MMGWRAGWEGRRREGGRREGECAPVLSPWVNQQQELFPALWGPSDCSVTLRRRQTLPQSAQPHACSSTCLMFNTYTGKILRKPREKRSARAVREGVLSVCRTTKNRGATVRRVRGQAVNIIARDSNRSRSSITNLQHSPLSLGFKS